MDLEQTVAQQQYFDSLLPSFALLVQHINNTPTTRLPALELDIKHYHSLSMFQQYSDNTQQPTSSSQYSYRLDIISKRKKSNPKRHQRRDSPARHPAAQCAQTWKTHRRCAESPVDWSRVLKGDVSCRRRADNVTASMRSVEISIE